MEVAQEVKFFDFNDEELTNLNGKSEKRFPRFSEKSIKREPFSERDILHEALFNILIKRLLITSCSFVLDCISCQTDCWNYIDMECGLAYVRVWNNNKITFNENDTVYRQVTQGAENQKFIDIMEKWSPTSHAST